MTAFRKTGDADRPTLYLRREDLFSRLVESRVTAVLSTEQDGVVVGVGEAAAAARSLGLEIEVVDSDQIVGKEPELLGRLALVDGVALREDASVHSEGVLGLVAIDPQVGSRAMEHAAELGRSIRSRLEKRVVLFATGFEVENGMIEDTNTPWLTQRFAERGYAVTVGGTLSDDIPTIAGALRRAAQEGYGLAVTTGGVGAEKKDCTIEALLRLDPSAETRYTAEFKQGTGRHVKPGVRIAVGTVEGMMVIALPGPHDEVVASAPVLLDCLDEHTDRADMASRIASALRSRFVSHGHHGPGSPGVCS